MDTPLIIPAGEAEPAKEQAFGGGIEGAERSSRETMRWTPSMLSPDRAINGVKPMADARGRDMVQNDGYAAGAEAIHKDSIVGAQYRLNASPNWRVLGASEGWAEEFQVVAENRFHTIAESLECWFDASRRNTFTGLIRLAVGGFVHTGEVLGTAEWIREPRRPCRTALQLISPDRLSNPDGRSDDRFLRRGIKRDVYGKPLSYFIRMAHPSEVFDLNAMMWKEVVAEKPWGRKQVIHIIDQRMPDQSRGIADMVAALKQMRMTKHFQEITLQNAVVNASYAAAIESELPTSDVFAAIGANNTSAIGGFEEYLKFYMGAMSSYLDGAKTIALDGVKIPHLFPGTKLNLKPVGTPGGVGAAFEESLLRHTAAALGLSYEEFARDFTKTNYSSARASMNNTWKFMQSRKRAVADRTADNLYALWLEEDIAQGNLPLPRGKTRDWFYEPLVKDALCQCSWIGASRGQIDETKETQAAILRIKSGLSTYEKECARLGDDFRDVFEQRAREEKIIAKYGLSFTMDTEKTTADSEGSPAPKKDKKPSEQAEASIQPQASAPLPVKLDLTVNHAPIEIRQEPVQVAVTHEPMQVTVTQEPIKIELSQADIHLHQQVVQQAAPKTKKVAIRDDDGLIVEMREVPDED
jgi:lambda family phage portal protein